LPRRGQGAFQSGAHGAGGRPPIRWILRQCLPQHGIDSFNLRRSGERRRFVVHHAVKNVDERAACEGPATGEHFI
jgi:hypothetical protein